MAGTSALQAAPPRAVPLPLPGLRGALARRAVTIPRTFLLFALITAALPLLALVAAAIDLVRAARSRTPAVALRLAAFLWCYLASEVAGLGALFAAWLAAGLPGPARARRLLDSTYAIQQAWTGFLLGAVKRVFRVRVEVEGDAQAAPGPVIVFVRHASIADTLLPTCLLGARHGLRLRFVLKRELLADPCLDVAGHRIPNHFVARDGRDSEAETDAVRALTRDLGAGDGVLIYPEGTRFTASKRRAALARLAEQDSRLLPLAERLRHVLPPRLGGALALLDGHTPADAVFMTHRGLEGLATIGDLWRGGLVGAAVRVRVWRVPRAEIPEGREARVAWLFEQWARVDAFVGEGAAAAEEEERPC